ncbi:asparagine synthase-related protein [Streptomyces parvus]|uniref:asparagine synthase-related protein n=1 Tax=Streptomyces parvus TaxID=66428 RepID=UPI00362D7465
MLSLQLRLSDLLRPTWLNIGDRWVSGDSWVEPAKAAALTTVFHGDDAPFVRLTVKERAPEEPDFLELLMKPGEARITAGVFGTAPVYVATVDDVLHASWDIAELLRRLRTLRLVPRVVARTLSRQHRYTTETLFEGVYRITERATAVFTCAGLDVRYPEPAEHVLRPRALRPGADPLGVLSKLLHNVVREAADPTAQVGVELSGGADSANVALAVASAPYREVRSFGLLMGDHTGVSQRVRRRCLVQHCGFTDTALPALQYPPFVPGGVRAAGRPHDPAGAFYQEAFDAVRTQAARRRCEVMFTGTGGDEVNAHHSRSAANLPAPPAVPWLGSRAERALRELEVHLAPMPMLPVPALMGFGLHNPGYLRVGVWPVSPLVHPRLVRFMEQLPHELKRGKALFRDRLRRAGLPESVASPADPENFLGVMETGLRHFGLRTLDTMLQESVLVDLGYVDAKALSRAREDAERAAVVPDLLCDTIALEVGLRSLM